MEKRALFGDDPIPVNHFTAPRGEMRATASTQANTAWVAGPGRIYFAPQWAVEIFSWPLPIRLLFAYTCNQACRQTGRRNILFWGGFSKVAHKHLLVKMTLVSGS
jgi:hypothetical protein